VTSEITGLDTFHPPPATMASDDVSPATGESPVTHEELESADLMDAEDPTGVSTLDHALESTQASHKDEDEIVIADDLAEEVDEAHAPPARARHDHDHEEEEHTDASATVPPFRSR
jgi:hypothetical protein